MATSILESTSVKEKISIDTLKKAYTLMCTAKSMTEKTFGTKEQFMTPKMEKPTAAKLLATKKET